MVLAHPASKPDSRFSVLSPPIASLGLRSLSARSHANEQQHAVSRTQSAAPVTGRSDSPSARGLLATFRHKSSSAASTPPATPLPSPALSISSIETSFVSKVSLRLQDAVNKVFPVPPGAPALAGTHHPSDAPVVVYMGVAAPRPDRAKEVGQIIYSQVEAALEDHYLLRSLLRSAILKALSILLSRLEGLVLPLASHPAAVTVPKSLKEADTSPPAQRFSLAIVQTAFQVRKSIDKLCTLADLPKFAKDTLAPWRGKMDSLIQRFMNPFIKAIKADCAKILAHAPTELAPIEAVGIAMTPSSSTTGKPAPAKPAGRGLGLTRSASAANGLALHATPCALPATAPNYVKELHNLLSAVHRLIERLECKPDQDKWIISIASLVIWKGLWSISTCKQVELVTTNGTTPPSSSLAAMSLSGLAKRANSPPSSSRSLVGVASSSKRRSPSNSVCLLPSIDNILLHELECLEQCITSFVGNLGLVVPEGAQDHQGCDICNNRYIPLDLEDSDSEDNLAHEAMQEARVAISSLVIVLRACSHKAALKKALEPPSTNGHVSVNGTAPGNDCPTLDRALSSLPPLLLLHLLAARLPVSSTFRLPHQIWASSWTEYTRSVGASFSSADEWTQEVAWEMDKECKRLVEAENSFELGLLIEAVRYAERNGEAPK